jgi:ArsR family transcriptional regulator
MGRAKFTAIGAPVHSGSHAPVARRLDNGLYFDIIRNIDMATKNDTTDVTRFADMFSAMGTEARLRIMQLLLSAHPDGLVVGDIGAELDIANSTLSHHLDKLRNEGLVNVQREGTFLRYSADTEALAELLGFLYAECCTRNKAVKPQRVMMCCK